MPSNGQTDIWINQRAEQYAPFSLKGFGDKNIQIIYRFLGISQKKNNTCLPFII